MALFAPILKQDDPPPPNADAVARRYGFDPTATLESRVGQTPDSVLKMFKEAGFASPKPHTLSRTERGKLAAALASLPPLHQRVLRERLRRVSFLDGMPNTALTSTVNPDDSYTLFDITIRAGVLRQTASEWLTEKECSLFTTTGSPLRVFIEAGQRDALAFVLLHEATHIVDLALGITPSEPAGKRTEDDKTTPHAFTKNVWSSRTQCAPPYRIVLRERIRFYPGGKPLPIAQAPAVYHSLQKTPFVSLYGGSNWGDDLAEFVAVYHWWEVLKQPYQIILRDGKETRLTYEPMQSPLVRSRRFQMPQFYAQKKA